MMKMPAILTTIDFPALLVLPLARSLKRGVGGGPCDKTHLSAARESLVVAAFGFISAHDAQPSKKGAPSDQGG
jgi:hypothetical protein